ncbi:MAG: AAA family ATPase, partial [Spirosomaceae bacterium]|nr:AAA family ATPase [Spirosomataceae bacterium]
MSKKYPIGLQDFEKIRKGNFLYLDKTMYIHRMVEQTGYFFLSRPRRFGKSLLIDTIQALYESKQSLFEGLFIANKWDWRKQNPVVRISFSNIGHKEKGLVKALQDSLDESAHKFNLSLKEEHISLKFKEFSYPCYPFDVTSMCLLISGSQVRILSGSPL